MPGGYDATQGYRALNRQKQGCAVGIWPVWGDKHVSKRWDMHVSKRWDMHVSHRWDMLVSKRWDMHVSKR